MRKNINKLIKVFSRALFVYLVFTMLFIAPIFARAAFDNTIPSSDGGSCAPGKLCNPIGSSSLADFLGKVADTVLKIGIPIAAVFIIFAGLKFVMAAGDEAAIKQAKQIFWYTIIGTAILLGATLLAKVLTTTVAQIFSK